MRNLDLDSLRHSGVRAALALGVGKMGSFAWSPAKKTAVGDKAVCDLFGIEFTEDLRPEKDFVERMHPEDRIAVEEAFRAAFEDGEPYDVEFRVVDGEETIRWLRGHGQVITAEDGDPMLVGVNWDYSDKKREQRNLEILAGEMDHRVKNTFAVILALVRLGRRTASDVETFSENLANQIMAMSKAHSVSAKLAREQAVPARRVQVGEVVRMALAPWLEATDERITLELDEKIRFLPRSATPLAMLLYELATNSAKHGALADAGGTLTVTLARDDDDSALLVWKECVEAEKLVADVQRERDEGQRSGFGSILTQHCVAELEGRIQRDMEKDGLRLELRMPIES